MADPRKKIRYDQVVGPYAPYKIDGTSIVYATDKAAGSAVAGRAVKISGNGIVALAGDNDPIHGKLILVEHDGMCTVQTSGYVDFAAGASATLTAGSRIVGAADAEGVGGRIKNALTDGSQEEAAEHRVVDAADPTSVWVLLTQ